MKNDFVSTVVAEYSRKSNDRFSDLRKHVRYEKENFVIAVVEISDLAQGRICNAMSVV